MQTSLNQCANIIIKNHETIFSAKQFELVDVGYYSDIETQIYLLNISINEHLINAPQSEKSFA